MSNTNERNYGIDLLRLVSMFLVCLRHTLSQGGVLAASSEISNAIYSFLFILTSSAVDCFAIISGYFATNKKIKFEKIIKMWFQVLFYSFGISLAINVLRIVFSSPEGFELSYVISSLFPLLNHRYWYFSAYVILFFFMPFLNKAFLDLNKEESKRTLLVLFILMIIMCYFRNASSHNFLSEGRSAFWLIIMYIVGLLINKSGFLGKTKQKTLILYFLSLNVLSFILSYYYNVETSINIYPISWLEAIVLVKIFEKMNVDEKIVSFLSPLSFGVFLFNTHYYFKYYFLSERFINYSAVNTVYGFVVVLFTSLFVFVAGLLADFIRTKVFKLFKIDILSKKICNSIESILHRLSTFM